MTSDFEKKWQSNKTEGIGDRLKSSLAPESNIRDRLQAATRSIDTQNRKLYDTQERMAGKDRQYYNKILDSLRTHDRDRATGLANELAQVRQSEKILKQARLALEQISVRLGTVQSIGDMAATLAPAVAIIKSVGGSLKRLVPEMDNEFTSIAGQLEGIMGDAGQLSGININFQAANEEAETILRDAETKVEIDMKEKLPSVPTTDSDIQL